jgi:hypothetical protein
MSEQDTVYVASPQPDEIKEAFDAAFAADNLLLPTGAKDMPKIRQIMLELIMSRKVLNKAEKPTKAVTRGALVSAVFPSLPGPDEYDEQPRPELAKAVFNKITSWVWGQTNPDPASKLQQGVVLNMGNGYCMCRTEIGLGDNNTTPAVYVTDNLSLIETDLVLPGAVAASKAADQHERILEMLIHRQPQHGKRFLTSWDTHQKSIAAGGRGRLMLALEAETAPRVANGDESEPEPETAI